MTSLLNRNRPLFFCPGCGHDHVVRAVDEAAQLLGIEGKQLVIVSDIGCSGLFDTFFNSHALHGLHGRALTYATGLKMVRPELYVLVVMGDGGLGIGGAHVLASCRRNLDITLLVLNNFNYGMTGGQCSSTTPTSDTSSSSFLNTLERPLDICKLAETAGALFAEKIMTTNAELQGSIAAAIQHPGFSLLDIWGLCPGRHLKKNPKTVSQLQSEMEGEGVGRVDNVECNGNKESQALPNDYGVLYRKAAAKTRKPSDLTEIVVTDKPRIESRYEILIVGAAGQYINSIGEIVCLAAMGSGLFVAQKNDYPITVLRGHSVAELVLDNKPISYTGMMSPKVIVCVAQEGIDRRKEVFSTIGRETLVLTWPGLNIPDTKAGVEVIVLNGVKVPKSQRALALITKLAEKKMVIEPKTLKNAINCKYSGKMRDQSIHVVNQLLS